MASIRFGTSEPQENSLHELTVAVTVPTEGIFPLPSLGRRRRRSLPAQARRAIGPPERAESAAPKASARSSAAELPYRSRWQPGG